jgi:hypothetical protein
MSAFEAAHSLRGFRLKHWELSDAALIETARAVNVNFFPHDYAAGIVLERLIPQDCDGALETFFTLAIDAVIATQEPFWLRLAPSGRISVHAALDDNGRQCFRSAGLMGTSERAVAWWDRLATSVRMEQNASLLAQGRVGERLSFERETRLLVGEGVDLEPQWVALDDNSLGYDILSYRRNGDHLVNRLIEAKTTFSRPPRLILTRNEWHSAHQFGSAFEFHVWLLPEEELIVRSVADILPHIPTNSGDGQWLDAEIALLP